MWALVASGGVFLVLGAWLLVLRGSLFVVVVVVVEAGMEEVEEEREGAARRVRGASIRDRGCRR